MDYITLIASLVGTLIGRGLSIGSALLVLSRQREHEKKNLEGAFAGEIAAILEIARLRDYVGSIQRLLDEIKGRDNWGAFPLKVRQEYFSVYKKNAHQLGLLDPPLPSALRSSTHSVFQFWKIAKQWLNPGINHRVLMNHKKCSQSSHPF